MSTAVSTDSYIDNSSDSVDSVEYIPVKTKKKRRPKKKSMVRELSRPTGAASQSILCKQHVATETHGRPTSKDAVKTHHRYRRQSKSYFSSADTDRQRQPKWIDQKPHHKWNDNQYNQKWNDNQRHHKWNDQKDGLGLKRHRSGYNMPQKRSQYW